MISIPRRDHLAWALASLMTSLGGPVACVAEERSDFSADLISRAAGVEQWSDLAEVRFTFHARQGEATVSRRWVWRPHDQIITLQVPEETVRFSAENITDQIQPIYDLFIYDRHWLFFPFLMDWEEDSRWSVAPDLAIGPLTQKSLRLVTLQKQRGEGVVGDAFDLFVDDDFRILESVTRPANPEEKALGWLWEGYVKVGGLTLSLERKSPDGARIWFADIQIIREHSGSSVGEEGGDSGEIFLGDDPLPDDAEISVPSPY